MAKEWIDVVDTAVKIGLGSLITGLFTYVGLKFTKKHEIKKYSIENKTRLLEESAKDILKYTSAWSYFIKSIGGLVSQLNNDDFIEIPNNITIDQLESDNKLIDAWANRDSAISTLILLNATDSVELLRKTNALESKLRDIIVFDNKLPSWEYLVDYSKEVKELVNEINSSLSLFYTEVHS